MRRFFKELLACRTGVTALEFAFVMPVVLLLSIGILEFSVLSFSTALLEGGLREAARFGITGLSPSAGSREQRIVEIVNAHASGLFTITTDDVETLVYQNFSEIGEPEPFTDSNGNGEYDSDEPYTDVNCNDKWDDDMGAAGAGTGDEVVLYTISHQYKTITGFLDKLIGANGTISLQASVAVRNEPFPGGPATCPTT